MEHLAPLIQTALWVGLIVGIVWRFNKPIHALLVSFQERVASGSSIKAGPFEIGQQLKPQDPSSQREKAEDEVRELLQSGSTLPPGIQSKSKGSLQRRYYEAEDLALRAIQDEYGVTISRQVTAGSDKGFDGAFALQGQFHIVEVKYSFHKISSQIIRSSIDRLISIIERYGWKNVKIILVIVYEEPGDIHLNEEQISKISMSYSVPINIRRYQFRDLEQKFGVSDDKLS